jgi:hypothetical protein
MHTKKFNLVLLNQPSPEHAAVELKELTKEALTAKYGITFDSRYVATKIKGNAARTVTDYISVCNALALHGDNEELLLVYFLSKDQIWLADVRFEQEAFTAIKWATAQSHIKSRLILIHAAGKVGYLTSDNMDKFFNYTPGVSLCGNASLYCKLHFHANFASCVKWAFKDAMIKSCTDDRSSDETSQHYDLLMAYSLLTNGTP